MPTNELLPEFRHDYAQLSDAQKRAFRQAVKKFVVDLRSGRSFRASLRVKSLQSYPGVFEMTWQGDDGRATFDYGPEKRPGESHVRWRHVGGHDIFKNP
jgi:hypothetical protein